ncbi:MAG: thioredoxin domain-containing protein [Acidobacteriota bacterium]|nr:thioredoxin domain-containing protein [Acidobacteriota bacterium]
MKNRTINPGVIALVLVAFITSFVAITADAQTMMGKKVDAKPTVVLLHADWCGACKKLEPTIAELKQQYGERLNFVELDVTNEETTAQAAKIAQQLGIGSFFETNKKKSSLVAVVGKNGKVLFQTHYSTNREGSFERETYVRAFDKAIAKS